MISQDPSSIAHRLRAQAYGVGFDLAGVATLGPAESAAAYDDWIAKDRHGEMQYMARAPELRRDARLPFPGARSALVVALDYGGKEPSGPVARYARGDDYHDVMKAKLWELHAWVERELGRTVRGRPYVDTGPLLERDLARRAGLGWFGKNTNLLNPTLGSFFFIGSLVLELDLEPDEPFASDHCGRCTRCLDVCPTEALVAPGELDARRCISYLTIELRGPIPEPLREGVGSLVYGCDLCQEVCPWNVKFAKSVAEPAFKARPWFELPSPVDWVTMSPEVWDAFSRGSPITRARRRGFLRNVAVALGNSGDARVVPALVGALSDEEPLVRGHAAWALGKIGSTEALEALRSRESVEADAWVRDEVRAAVRGATGRSLA